MQSQALLQPANKLLNKIRSHTFADVKNITASTGVNCFAKNMLIETTIHNADQTLYQSKENGRDCIIAFKMQYHLRQERDGSASG